MTIENLPKDLLNGKTIALGVTASIAIYKSLELIRLFVKTGASVRVVMSEEAKKFVAPLTFEAISANRVLHSQTEEWASPNNHIGLAQNCDIFVIAPATANTINKLKNGIADNLLLSSVLACNKTKIIAPAANTAMIMSPITQGSLKFLKLAGYIVAEPQTKLLACNTEGVGAMAEPIEIFYKTARKLLCEAFWKDRRVVVTGGGTIEKIDDVRYISNFSSGKMAESVALALYLRGADVCLITTKKHENLPQDIHTIQVESAREMKEYVEESLRIARKGILKKPTLLEGEKPVLIQKTPYLFMAAAVSDYTPAYAQSGKLKKELLGERWSLDLAKNVDILATVDKKGVVAVGFKAEMDAQNAHSSAKAMLEAKNLDAVCLNVLSGSASFGADTNQIDFITANQSIVIPKGSKFAVALAILKNAQMLAAKEEF